MFGGSGRYTKIQCRESNSIVYCYYIHYICSCCFCREAGFTNIAQRLIEVQYELTDRLTYYLCGRRPGYCLFLFLFRLAWLMLSYTFTIFVYLVLIDSYSFHCPDHQNGVHYLIPTMADRSGSLISLASFVVEYKNYTLYQYFIAAIELTYRMLSID